MTRLPLLLLSLALLAAGCTTPGDGDAEPPTNETTDGTTGGALPAPIEDSQQVTGSADPLPVTGAEPCESPSAQCFRYPFELNTSATISVSLTWTVPANDFDVYIFQDGAAITSAEGGSAPPGTSESFELDLEPGSYEVVVSAYGVSQDTFTLLAEFAGGAAAPATNATAEL